MHIVVISTNPEDRQCTTICDSADDMVNTAAANQYEEVGEAKGCVGNLLGSAGGRSVVVEGAARPRAIGANTNFGIKVAMPSNPRIPLIPPPLETPMVDPGI